MLFLSLLLAALPQSAVATSEPNATATAAEILALGGNAVDASIAAGFTLAVTYPVAGNLGGGGFLLYRDPNGEAFFLDFREVAPEATDSDFFLDENGDPLPRASRHGWTAAGVPGTVPGMMEAHRRWGSIPWSRIVEPALRLARDGFPVSKAQSQRLGRSAKRLARDPLAKKRLLAHNSEGPPVGFQLHQPELAETLEQIAAYGDAPFRSGPLVEALVAASNARGGALQAEDFESYQPLLRSVRTIRWRGLEVLTATAPSSGGLFLGQCLALLDSFPLAAWGYKDSRSALLIAETSAYAFVDRNRWMGDPAGFDFDPWDLVSKEYLAAMRSHLSPRRYTPPAVLGRMAPAPEKEETTHYSVVDAEGGAVSVTTTLNGAYGAGVMAPGGFLMNNEMDDFAAAPGKPNLYGLVQGPYNAVHPGRRPLSSMCPTIVVREGKVDAVIGSPGGPTILSTVLHLLLNRYVFAMTPRQTVAAPRAHRQDRPPTLLYEAGRFSTSVLSSLRAAGQPLSRASVLGDVNAIFRMPTGAMKAFADPRHHGLAMTMPGPIHANK